MTGIFGNCGEDIEALLSSRAVQLPDGKKSKTGKESEGMVLDLSKLTLTFRSLKLCPVVSSSQFTQFDHSNSI